MTDKRGPLALIILDGFGYSPRREGNAVALARMPFYDELLETLPAHAHRGVGRVRRAARRA